jgi:hypothetical protein
MSHNWGSQWLYDDGRKAARVRVQPEVEWIINAGAEMNESRGVV